MSKESACSLFFLEDDKTERLWCTLQRLTRNLLQHIRQRPLTQRLLLDIEEAALVVARSACNLHDRIALEQRQSAQPTHLSDRQDINFSELQ